MIYAAIGSRKTPDDIQVVMFKIAYEFASRGYILRSGGANGADMAFQRGCETWCDENDIPYFERQEIYLPWDGFNGLSQCDEDGITIKQHWLAREIASEHHPTFDTLSESVKTLMARNTMQMFGTESNSPETDLVICWTPDGAISKTTPNSGGTGQAIRMASHSNIPVINLKRDVDLMYVEEMLTAS